MNRGFPVVVVTLRYWAAARAAAAAAEDVIELGGTTTLAGALALATTRHGAEFARVLALASVLLDGTRVDRAAYADTRLADGAVVEILPPFAGG